MPKYASKNKRSRFHPYVRTAARVVGGVINRYGKYMAGKALQSGAQSVRNFLDGYSSRISYRDYVRGKGKGRSQVTPGGKIARLNRVGAISSKSAGRLKTRRFKKWAKKTLISKGGIELTSERGKVQATTDQTLWVGHSCVCMEDLALMSWRLIIKKLFAKCGVCVRSFTEVATQNAYNVSAGDLIVVRYQTADIGAVLAVSYTVVAGDTFDTFAIYFNTLAAFNVPNVTYKSIAFNPTVNAVGALSDASMVRMDLEFQNVEMYFKSTMKIQNRTVNAAGDDEDSVDNVPLYGKSYAGFGNGVVQLARATGSVTQQMIASSLSGYILGSAVDGGLDEPTHGQYFQYVTERGKVHLDPGFIKTSSLVYSKKMSLNALQQMIHEAVLNTKTRISFGKYRLFGIEKMIDTSAGGTTITVGLEINNYLSINMKSSFPNASQPLFLRSAAF